MVLIYAESLERSYFDESVFPGLIRGLREVERQSTYFTNIKQAPGTGWTIAGMTASQCAIPLFTPSHGNSMSGMDQFLGSATCLGDLLSQADYHLEYMGGASLRFAGKGKFYKSHSFSEVNGREELLAKLPDATYKTAWGLFDDSLFDMVYERFIELSEKDEKFGLFTLTLDTHHPNGHPSKSCEHIQYKDGKNPILNAVACSDFLITRLIQKIKNSRYADNTIIVLVSDHLAMRNTAFNLLNHLDRKGLFMIIDGKTFKEIDTLGSTLDIGVTILPFIGYTGQIGLGRNLSAVFEGDKERATIRHNLPGWKQEILQFWDFPSIQVEIQINPEARLLNIDKRAFTVPVLIEFNQHMETTLKFEFDRCNSQKTLIEQRQALNPEQYFILIDKCEKIHNIVPELKGPGLCLVAGRGQRNMQMIKIDKTLIYSVDTLRKMLGM